MDIDIAVPLMGRNVNYAPNAIAIKIEAEEIGLSEDAIDFLAKCLIPDLLLKSVEFFNENNRNGDLYLSYWLDLNIFEKNVDTFKKLIAGIKISLPSGKVDVDSLALAISQGESTDASRSALHKTKLIISIESLLKRNRVALETFIERTDVLQEFEASRVLNFFIRKGIFKGNEDLVQNIVDRIHGWKNQRSGLLGFQGPGKWFDKKISETERGILAELTLAGFTIKFPSFDGDIPTNKPEVIREYHKVDTDYAEALRVQLEHVDQADVLIDLIRNEITGFNDQGYVDELVPALRLAMQDASPQVIKCGRRILEAILDKGYTVKSPLLEQGILTPVTTAGR